MTVFRWPPISVSTTPPVGAATAANQLLEIAELEALNLVDFATEAKQDTQITRLNLLATEAKQDTQITSLASLLTELQLKADLTETQPVSGPLTDTQLRASAVPVTANAGTNLNTSALALETTQTANGVLIGAVIETAPASDTASSGLNGRLQRIAQRLTSLIALLPASLGSKADAASLAVTQSTEDKAGIGSLTETAPASDTASSGLNGRLQRIAQRLTSLIALLPASLGIKTAAASLSIAPASDAVFATSSGTTSGTVTSAQVAVGTSAVRATVAGTAPSATRKRLLIKSSKNNTGLIYLGASGVTTSNGLEIIGPDRLEFLADSSDYYLISDTAAQVVEIVEVA